MKNYVIHYESDGEKKKLWLGNVSKDHAELRLAVVKFYKWNKNARLENLEAENVLRKNGKGKPRDPA